MGVRSGQVSFGFTVVVLAALSGGCDVARPPTDGHHLTACGDCHAFPPETGAHRAHLGSTSGATLLGYGNLETALEDGPDGPAWRFGCGYCHPLDARRHRNGHVDVELFDAAAPEGSLKAQSAPGARYAGGRCSGAYCHGGAQGAETPPWRGPLAPLGCDGCHAAPPPTGAHAVHVGDAEAAALVRYGDLRTLADYRLEGGPAYLFGCGSCHPADRSRHVDGRVEVELDGLSAAPGTLRAENGDGAGYTAGRCGNVYCHSSGQAASARTYVVTPDWYGPAGTLGCGGCHGNPPRQANAGPGDGANGHYNGWDPTLGLGGHVSTVTLHGRPRHGLPVDTWDGWASVSAPMTCQTCHFGTVDPSNTGPGGFYYFDTTGDYADPASPAPYRCQSCHNGQPGGQPAGRGKILPLLHVNGRRDVLFDRRETLPNGYPAFWSGLPPRPYWHFEPDGMGTNLAGVDAVFDLTGTNAYGGAYGSIMSWNLKNTQWDPATKSCSAVPCHLQKQTWTWGIGRICSACHSGT